MQSSRDDIVTQWKGEDVEGWILENVASNVTLSEEVLTKVREMFVSSWPRRLLATNNAEDDNYLLLMSSATDDIIAHIRIDTEKTLASQLKSKFLYMPIVDDEGQPLAWAERIAYVFVQLAHIVKERLENANAVQSLADIYDQIVDSMELRFRDELADTLLLSYAHYRNLPMGTDIAAVLKESVLM